MPESNILADPPGEDSQHKQLDGKAYAQHSLTQHSTWYSAGWSVFNRSLPCLVSASSCLTAVLSSWEGITSFSLRASSKLSRSLQWNMATQRVCSQRSLRTALYFWVSTQTEVPAWRPLKASSDSMSFFLVRALRALQSSMMYRVGSPWKTWYIAQRQSCNLSPGSMT